MISANHPQRILAAQPFITDHDILKCIVKRMADMERSGHVGWRIDNSEGLRVGAFRTEQSLAFPMRIPARLNGGGLERSEEHTSELQSLMRISYAVFCLKKKIKPLKHKQKIY